MIVVKFGGTSLAGTEHLRSAARIVAAHRNEQSVVCVVSAMAGVTDQLLSIANHIMEKSEITAQTLLTALIAQHEQVMRGLTTTSSTMTTTTSTVSETTSLTNGLANSFAALRSDLERLAALCDSVNTGDKHNDHENEIQHALAAFSGWGERLSVYLFSLALAAKGVAAVPFVDEPVVMVARETATALAAHQAQDQSSMLPSWEHLAPSVAATRAYLTPVIAPQLQAGQVPVLPGYLARTGDGLRTTLGRNGSDYSAALVAATLGADTLYLYSDVAGIRRADPRVVPEAVLLPALTYADAAEMSVLGARVLHPDTLRPLAAAGIPLYLRSSFNPDALGTLIGTPSCVQSSMTTNDAAHSARPAWVVIARNTTNNPLFERMNADRAVAGLSGQERYREEVLVEVTGLYLRHGDLPAQEDDHLRTPHAPLIPMNLTSTDSLNSLSPGNGPTAGALALLSNTPRPVRLALAACYISVDVPATESDCIQRRLYKALLHADERATSAQQSYDYRDTDCDETAEHAENEATEATREWRRSS